MSPVAIALDILLAGLLIASLVVGYRLNARLKLLRAGQAEFARAVAELNAAATTTERGLSDLRAASEESHDSLLARIETARQLTARLEQATQRAEKAADKVERALTDIQAAQIAPARPSPAAAASRDLEALPPALSRTAAALSRVQKTPGPAARRLDALFEAEVPEPALARAAPQPSPRPGDAPSRATPARARASVSDLVRQALEAGR